MSDTGTPETMTAEVTPSAPAIQTDTLWDGPRWIENAGPEPVWVETKQQYWDLLNTTGFTMKGQQESSTGPERDPQTWIAPPVPLAEQTPEKVLTPFRPDEGALIYAEDAILRRYGLREALYCENCAIENRPHGCRVQITPRRIVVQCRCGVRMFQPPMGTTDLSSTMGNLAVTLNDQQAGTARTDDGTPMDVTVIWLHVEETRVIRAYLLLMRRYGYAPFLQCSTCHAGQSPIGEDTTMGIHVTAERVALLCKCRMFCNR